MNSAAREEPAGEILDALVAENRRLRRERADLKARLEAIDRGQRPRLGLRTLLRNHRSRASHRPQAPPAHDENTRTNVDLRASTSDAPLAGFQEEVVARGEFSRGKYTVFSRWEPFLVPLEGARARLLEIGSFEGLSACYLLWRLPDAEITCVDTFAGSLEDHIQGDVSQLEAIFERNAALVDRVRVRKLVGDSKRVLLDLIEDSERFDLVYVDGSHLGLDVIVDAALSWQLLAWDGTLVFDDYAWAQLGTGPLLRPGPAIDAFLGLIEGSYELVFSEYQLALKKIRHVADPFAAPGA